MGAALCSCGGRGDELGSRALAPGGGLYVLGLDRHLHARNGKAVPLAIAAKYSSLVPPSHPLQFARATPEQHSRGETYALSDDCGHDEDADEPPRPVSAQAIADAFRAKLHEPPLSPRSKFNLLITKIGGALDESEDEDEDDEDDESDDAATRTCEDEEDENENEDECRRHGADEREETPEGGITRRKRRRQRGTKAAQGLRARRKAPLRPYGSSFAAAAYAASDADDVSLTEEDWKARANPLVTIIVPPGPCGLVLQVDAEAQGRQPPTVDGFVRTYDGMKGTIENSGLVHKGSVLCAINDIDVTRMPLKEVIRTLNLSSHLERAFTFRNGFQHRNSM
jgi:hypothetical protein